MQPERLCFVQKAGPQAELTIGHDTVSLVIRIKLAQFYKTGILIQQARQIIKTLKLIKIRGVEICIPASDLFCL